MEQLIEWLDEHADTYGEIADEIWSLAEGSWEETQSSKLQANHLEGHGFSTEWNIADIPTAFIAEWGAGSPILGFVGEYDALPGLSQSRSPFPEPIEPGGHGHGCGHNLLGTGGMAAAVALRYWLEHTGSAGTVRYYGCPAEEQISAKTFMARTGCFDDLSAAFNFHPSNLNMPLKGTSVGVADAVFVFHGTAAHAGGAPEKGRSALDAVELMNVGVNYLREHVPDKVRIHYCITNGGDAPNIVPAEASVWYYVRALERSLLNEVYERVCNVARGAAMMTDTEVEIQFNGACSSVLNNHRLADLQYDVMTRIGPIDFTEEELSLAAEINSHYPEENSRTLFDDFSVPETEAERVKAAKGRPLVGENFPAMDETFVGTGSTDVGDVSWITPLSMLNTACYATGAGAHSWGVVSSSASSFGKKGMMHAAKIMGAAAAELVANPDVLRDARREFEERVAETPYENPIPDGVVPPPLRGDG